MKASKEQEVTMPAKSILATITAQKNKGLLKTHKWQSKASSTQWRIKEWISPKAGITALGWCQIKQSVQSIDSYSVSEAETVAAPLCLLVLHLIIPPRALQMLHWSLQKSIGFSCETAGGLSRVSPAVPVTQHLHWGNLSCVSQKLKSATYCFLKNYIIFLFSCNIYSTQKNNFVKWSIFLSKHHYLAKTQFLMVGTHTNCNHHNIQTCQDVPQKNPVTSQ